MISLAWHYLSWHYSRGVHDFLRVWSNLVWFSWNFFSVGLLFSTLLMPFRRIRDERERKGFDPGAFAESVLVSIIMRIVGIIVRSILIIAGLAVCAILLSAGTVLFISWFLAPALYALMLVSGFYILIT